MIHLALFLLSTLIVAVASLTASILLFWLVLLAFSAVYSLLLGLLQLVLYPFYLVARLRRRLTRP
jgi:hypothetical protein